MFRRFKNLKNSGIHKKLVTLVVTSFIVINSTVIPIHAAPSYDATNVAQLKQAVENRLSQFNKNDITNYTGELGIFYNGKRIISQAIWTEFINSPRAKVLDIDESVKKYQNEQMIEILKTFNESYFVDDKGSSDGKDSFLSLTLDKDDVDKNKFYAGRIAQDLAKYINEYLDKQLSDFKNNKEELVNAKRLELRYIYDIVNAPIDDIKAINALLPQTANTDKSGATTFSKDPYSIGNTCSPLTDIMKASDKSQVLRLAQEINKDEMSEIGVDNIDNNLNLIDRFYKGGSQNNEELINTYYLMMSASSVYEPFISHVGDDYFKRALLKVAGEDDKTGAIWKLYTDANLYKKPLYMREIDRDGKVSGTAERVTLDKFVTSVLDGESGALVMPVGMVVKGKDSNSYNIYNTDRFKWTKGDSETNKKKVQAQEGPQTGNNQANATPTPGTGINGSNTGGTPNNGTGSSTTTDGSVVTPSNDGSNMAGAQAPEDDAVNNYLQQNNLDPNGGQNTQQGQGQNQTQNQNQNKSNENAATKGSDKKVEESLENTEFTPDGSPISAEDKVTPPVFTWGKYSFTKKMHMGTVVMTNILKDVTHLKDFEKKNKMLFMNAFGDIVTENDVVILPAASNPTLFNNNKTFYPYSLGFMKPYPNLKANENVFKVGKGDQGKYVLSIERENEMDDSSKDKEAEKKGKAKESEVISGNNLKQGNDKEVSISEISGDTNLALSRKFSTTQFIQANMRDMGSGKTSMLRFKHYKFKSDNWWKKVTSDMVNNVTSSNMFSKECLMAKVPADVISEGKSVVLFESDLKDLTDQDLGMIASNYYWGVMSDGDGNMTSPNGNLNTTLFQKWIVPQALNGVTNTQVYTKNLIQNYDEKVEEATNMFTNIIRKLTKSVVSVCGDVNGVLGIKGAYNDYFLGRVMVYCRTYMPYLVAVGILLVMIRLITRQISLFQAGIAGVIVVTTSIVFTTYIPIWLPTVFNVANNNLALNLAYNTVLMKSENYQKVYSDNKDAKGNTLIETVSMNLAKLNNDDLDYMCGKYDISKDDLASGKGTVINYEAGIFLQGNILKCNVDKLFKNQPIVGSYVSDKKGGVTYEIKAKKMVSSQMDYYTPYHLIVNSFTQRLNDFSSVYDLNRSTLRYDNMIKDSFMVTSYMDSAVFLAPGDWKKVLEEENTPPHIIQDLQNKFDNAKEHKDPYDFIGLRTFLQKIPKEAKETLWYKTMVQNGYLKDENITGIDGAKATDKDEEEAMNDLVYYVNRHVKKFMLDNAKIFKGMSDENMIKVISLYATNLLSQKAGNWGNELYPMYLNYEELNLCDVLLASYVSDSDRFISTNLDVVNYIFDVYGWFMVIIFGVTVIVTGLLVTICEILVPVLYLALGVIMVLRFAFNDALSPVIKGYSKCCGVVFLCYTLNCLMLSTLSRFSGNVWCIWVQLLFACVLLDTLLRLCFAILTNVSELGNSRMNVVAPSVIQKLGDLTVNGAITNFRYRRYRDENYTKKYIAGKYEKYKQGRPLDDFESKINLGRKIKHYDNSENERRDIREDMYKDRYRE